VLFWAEDPIGLRCWGNKHVSISWVWNLTSKNIQILKLHSLYKICKNTIAGLETSRNLDNFSNFWAPS
jgi:hypothetical protein